MTSTEETLSTYRNTRRLPVTRLVFANAMATVSAVTNSPMPTP